MLEQRTTCIKTASLCSGLYEIEASLSPFAHNSSFGFRQVRSVAVSLDSVTRSSQGLTLFDTGRSLVLINSLCEGE